MTWLADFMAREALPAEFAGLVDSLWAPLADEIAAAARAHGRPGFVAGINGAQGSGKSTACAVLAELLGALGLSTAVLSLDDLYLTHDERHGLAARVHPLLRTRGVPGTHAVGLGIEALDALAGSGEVSLPRFIKALDSRADPKDYGRVMAPVDVVLFEGWCVGARPQPPQALAEPVNALERARDPDGVWRRYVNDQLAGPYQDLFRRIGWILILQAPSFEVVLGWRQEQEAKLAARLAAGGDGGRSSGRAMTPEQVADFVSHYERLTRFMLTEMPPRADRIVRLDALRGPIQG